MTKLFSFLIIIFSLWFCDSSWGKELEAVPSDLTPNPLRPHDPYALPGAVPSLEYIRPHDPYALPGAVPSLEYNGAGLGLKSSSVPSAMGGRDYGEEKEPAPPIAATVVAVASIGASKDCCDCSAPLLRCLCASRLSNPGGEGGGIGISDCINTVLCCPLKCAWGTLKCAFGCIFGCCCSSSGGVAGTLALASSPLVPSESASPLPPPKPPRVPYTLLDKNALAIDGLNGFWFLGDSQHPAYPFGDDFQNTIYLKGKYPKFNDTQLNLLYTGVSQVILEFPLNSLDPLKRLGSKGADDNHVSPYILHIRGLMKSSDFKKLRRLLVSWVQGEGAVAEYLDFAIQGIQGAEVVKEVVSLLRWPVGNRLKGLGIRFAGLTDKDLKKLQQGLEGGAYPLEALVLSSNQLTDKSLDWISEIVKPNRRFPKLQRIHLEGNDFSTTPNIKPLVEGLKKRTPSPIVHLGFNGIDSATLRAQVAEFDSYIKLSKEVGFTSLHAKVLRTFFNRHETLLEEDPSFDLLAQWRHQLWTVLAFGSQPLRSLNFNGMPLEPQALGYLLKHVRSSSLHPLHKLSLVGSIGVGGDHTLLTNQLQRFPLRSLNLGGNFRGTSAPVLEEYLKVLAGLSSLVYLGLSDNDLGSRDDLASLWVTVQGLKNLTVLDLGHNGLTTDHLGPLVTALTGSKLQYLNVSGNAITLDAPTIVRVVQDISRASGESFQWLNLMGNSIVGTVVGKLMQEYGASFPILQIDGVTDVKPSEDSTQSSELTAAGSGTEVVAGSGEAAVRGPVVYLGNRNLYKSLSRDFYNGPVPFRLLRDLPDFHGRGLRIDPQGLRTLSRTLTGNLRQLDLGYNRLTPETVKDLAQLLILNSGMESLGLSHMGIGSNRAGLLASALCQMSQLRDLDLSGNRMTKVGFRAIVGSLQAKPLEVLNLGGNTLKKGSAKTLKTLLPGLRALRELVLDNNQFGKGAKLLAEALQTTVGLTHLDLSRNGIGLSEMNLLVSGIASQTNLTKLSIGSNPLKDAGAVPLSIMLRSLPALKALSVPGSRFSEPSALVIRNAIEEKELDFLDISNQRKGFPGREVFGGVGVKHLVVGP